MRGEKGRGLSLSKNSDCDFILPDRSKEERHEPFKRQINKTGGKKQRMTKKAGTDLQRKLHGIRLTVNDQKTKTTLARAEGEDQDGKGK